MIVAQRSMQYTRSSQIAGRDHETFHSGSRIIWIYILNLSFSLDNKYDHTA